jgi:hypothetical protein
MPDPDDFPLNPLPRPESDVSTNLLLPLLHSRTPRFLVFVRQGANGACRVVASSAVKKERSGFITSIANHRANCRRVPPGRRPGRVPRGIAAQEDGALRRTPSAVPPPGPGATFCPSWRGMNVMAQHFPIEG